MNALTARVAWPLGDSTTTSTVRSVPIGVTAVISSADSTVTLAAARPPTRTSLPATKFVPAMVRPVPPDAGPWAGVTESMSGGGSGVALASSDETAGPLLVVVRTLKVYSWPSVRPVTSAGDDTRPVLWVGPSPVR